MGEEAVRILIVDDYPGVAEAVCKLLRDAGHECRSETSGTRALAIADAFVPELAVLDISLPDIDGYTLVDRLRRRSVLCPPYFVAMSGRKHALAAALEVGFDACLLKPASREQLLRLVELAQRRQVSHGPSEDLSGAEA
jgi:CheY-like chemotaxis protein